jgi:hypothetical protein
MTMHTDPARELQEREEQAQIILDMTIDRLRELGFGIAAYSKSESGVIVERMRPVLRDWKD